MRAQTEPGTSFALTNSIHGNAEFNLLGGLVPRAQVTEPSSYLKREFLALRNGK